jgi:hypothetical protein
MYRTDLYLFYLVVYLNLIQIAAKLVPHVAIVIGCNTDGFARSDKRRQKLPEVIQSTKS